MTATDTWIDKSAWGDGPWGNEPDRLEWRHEGIACLALRNPTSGNWCGYAAVPPGHPWHGLSFGHEDEARAQMRGTSLDAAHDAAHGGLTFADRCMNDERPARERVCHVPQPGESDDVWWLGFDCAHAWDRRPAMEARERSHGYSPIDHDAYYRTLPYVQASCEALADAILEAGTTGPAR